MDAHTCEHCGAPVDTDGLALVLPEEPEETESDEKPKGPSFADAVAKSKGGS